MGFARRPVDRQGHSYYLQCYQSSYEGFCLGAGKVGGDGNGEDVIAIVERSRSVLDNYGLIECG
jgi:hypothetical protein